MDKIILHLSRAECLQLAGWVLAESGKADGITEKYVKAVVSPTLKQVYIKLHNKLHSLKEVRNALNLTLPEASVLGTFVLELKDENYLAVSLLALIDQKLT